MRPARSSACGPEPCACEEAVSRSHEAPEYHQGQRYKNRLEDPLPHITPEVPRQHRRPRSCAEECQGASCLVACSLIGVPVEATGFTTCFLSLVSSVSPRCFMSVPQKGYSTGVLGITGLRVAEPGRAEPGPNGAFGWSYLSLSCWIARRGSLPRQIKRRTPIIY